jgi:hypothetical protein
METFRCPSCLFVLLEPDSSRCPSCHKRLGGRRARPIVLGNKYKFGSNPPPHIDLTHVESVEPSEEPVTAATAETPAISDHTRIFEPSQLDPELREVLDELYRKARADISDDRK